MTFGRWLTGLVAVSLVLGAAWLCARALRLRLAPSPTGAAGVLADLVLALALLTTTLQGLGIVGLLEGWVILAVAVLAMAAAARLRGVRPFTTGVRPHTTANGGGVRPFTTGVRPLTTATALVLGGVVVAAWLRRTLVSLDLGIGGVDSLWYHLPFAARFAQEGSIAAVPYVELEFLTAFYPANVELLHAGGFLAFGGDALSPWLNLGFLALGLLAGWCLGATRGAGPAGLVAAAVVFAVPAMFETQPGEAKNDAFALAVTLAAAALLVEAAARREGLTAGLALLGGLAAGLAVGAKLSFLAPAGALTIAVVVLARGRRLRVGGAWCAGLLATSGVWYARNLVATGNPLPWLDLGPLPNPAESRSADTADPLSDYLFDGGAWDEIFLPGLEGALGPAWWAILALAAAGAVLAVLDGDRTVRALGIVALVTAAAYVVTPSTAAGPEGRPIGFPLNVRYLTPSLLLGLCLLAVARPRRQVGLAVAAALAAILVATQFADPVWADEHRRKAIAAVAAGLVLVAVAVRVRPVRWAVPAVVAVVALAAWPLVRDLDRQAYTAKRLPYTSWAAFQMDAAYAWARDAEGTRIAVIGTTGSFFQFPLTGRRLQHEVRLLGDRGEHGSFTPLRDCATFRETVDAGRFTHLVLTPDLDIWDPYRPQPSRVRGWLDGTGARSIAGGARVAVFALPASLGPAGCPRP